MLKISKELLLVMESQHPGILKNIARFEAMDLPGCPNCGSDNTADVQVGVIGRTIYISIATTKFRLIPNLPRPGRFFCNACGKYFDVPDQDEKYGKPTGGFTIRLSDSLENDREIELLLLKSLQG